MSIWVKFKNWFWGDLKEPEPEVKKPEPKAVRTNIATITTTQKKINSNLLIINYHSTKRFNFLQL